MICESNVAGQIHEHADRSPVQRILEVLDALPCGAAIVDRSGRLMHANRRVCEMMKRAPEQVIGHHLYEFYPDEQGHALIRGVLEHFDEEVERELYVLRPDGSRLAVLVSGRPLRLEASEPQHRLVTLFDISEQKKAEQQARERLRDVSQLSDTVLEQALALKDYSHTLEERVAERTRELDEANMEAIYMLAIAGEAKDLDTGAHVRRMQGLAEQLALEMGMSPAEAKQIGYSAILHDVGKMQVPDDILKKPAGLTVGERSSIEQHTLVGEHILSKKAFFDVARAIARSHHENWDGSGYPDGLAGEAIPLAARIVHLADVFDALTSQRPYKQAWSAADAAEAIEAGSGRSFDPVVVRAFRRLFSSNRLNHDPEKRQA